MGGLLCLLANSAFAWPGRVDKLVAALHEADDAALRSDLVRLLSSVQAPAALAALIEACTDQQPGVRAEAVLGLARGDEPPLEIMRPLLADPASEVRAAAATALAHDPESVDRLIRTLADEDAAVRAASARSLGSLRQTRAVSALSSALSDPSSEVASAAAEALCQLPGHDAAALLASRFPSLPLTVQRSLLGALGEAPRELAEKPAAVALHSEHDELLLAGLQLVVRHRLSAQLPTVQTLLHANQPVVAHAAALALTVLSSTSRPAGEQRTWLPALLQTGKPDLNADQQEAALRELERFIPEGETLAGDPLAEWLLRAPTQLATRIARLLARTGAAVKSEPLLPLLGRGDGELRAALCEILAHSGEPKLAEQLLPLLADPEADVRSAAARAVGTLADVGFALELAGQVDELETLSTVQQPRVAHALALATSRLAARWDRGQRKEVRRALLHALETDDEETAAYLLRSLATLEPGAASELLRRQGSRLRLARRVALLRASAAHTSGASRELRAQYRRAREPALVATALVAQLVAGELSAPQDLLPLLEGQRWPVGPLASFALIRSSPGRLAELREELCSCSLRAREPLTRHNLRVALTKIAAPCHGNELGDDTATLLLQTTQRQAAATFRALLLPDQSVLVSVPDAANDASWPAFQALGEQSAWHLPYRSNH